MSLGLIGTHTNEIFKFDEENLIIIIKGSWDIYWKFANEDLKVEYIKESIYIHSPASLIHERAFKYLLLKIESYSQEKILGEVVGSRFPVVLNDGRRVEPDILFVSTSDIKGGELTNTYFKGRPTWIIEIISPSYKEYDTVTKKEEYRKLNVREYWIVDPEEKSLEIIRFKDNKQIYQNKYHRGKVTSNLEEFGSFEIDLDNFWKKIH